LATCLRFFFTFLLLIYSISPGNAQNVDIDLLRSINHNRNPNLDGTFQFISNSAFVPEIAFPAVFIGIGLIKKDKVLRDKGFETGASLIFASLLATVIKYSINRERPFQKYPDIQKLSSGGDPSFPSGHTSSAFALATSLSLNWPKWYVIVPAYTWASAVAYSRMDMGVHYPSDVLVGIIVGSGCAVLSHYISQRLHRPKMKTVKPIE
jgi:membrane-associated phospholipid phosphatase